MAFSRTVSVRENTLSSEDLGSIHGANAHSENPRIGDTMQEEFMGESFQHQNCRGGSHYDADAAPSPPSPAIHHALPTRRAPALQHEVPATCGLVTEALVPPFPMGLPWTPAPQHVVPSPLPFPSPPVAKPTGNDENKWQNIPHVYSSRQLIPTHESRVQDKWQPDDKNIYMPTFGRLCYITCHENTFVEFNRYLPLVKHGEEGKWYHLVDLDTQLQLNELEDAGLAPGRIPALINAAPAKQEVPMVQGGSALRATLTVKAIPCENPQHAASVPAKEATQLSDTEDFDLVDDAKTALPLRQRCKRCAKAKEDQLRKSELLYITVVRTAQESKKMLIPPPPPPPPSVGPPTAPNNYASSGSDIYKVVKVGSREASASEAFYNAGAKGYSTVFTLVTRADVDWSFLADEGVKRVDELWQLTEDTNGPIPVFF